MAKRMYRWRKMTEEERGELLAAGRLKCRPWHSPPHRERRSDSRFHISGACYEHKPHIGRDAERLEEFSAGLLGTLVEGEKVEAWCVLPNHYHLLVETGDLISLMQ